MMFKLPWKLSDLEAVQKNGLKVFSCFHCGGGSTMGYKLAGYEVLGGVEIDPEMMAVYRANHHPKYSYLMGVQEFNKIPNSEIPKELFELDILDGSPPCSSFSMAGSREKAWGVKKKFREGQSEQVLDDLFFHFIETSRKLQPKVVIAENVKGLVIGKAKGYVKQIRDMFNLAGYDVQLFLLNAAFMGVPQKRERTFFIAHRKDFAVEPLKLQFGMKPISVSQAFSGLPEDNQECRQLQKNLWLGTKPGKSFSSVHPKGSFFNAVKLHPNEPANTLAAQGGSGGLYHWSVYRKVNRHEALRIQSFPDDYSLKNMSAQYICGMSVPPIMMAQVARQIDLQWFSKLRNQSAPA